MAVRVGDLKEQTGESGPHPFLYCEECGEECSANKTDYFLLPDDYVFRHCGYDMKLVRRRAILEEVKL